MAEFERIMEKNITDLLTIFDDIKPQSPEDEANEKYVFICNRPEITIYLQVIPLEMYSSISLDYMGKHIPFIEFKFCKRIRVIDTKKKNLEIIAGSPRSLNVRCFLELTGENHTLEIDTQYEYNPNVY